jgi:hypothetical protein
MLDSIEFFRRAAAWHGACSIRKQHNRKETPMKVPIVVRFNPADLTLSLDPSSITLTDSVEQVGWKFADLPDGYIPAITFGGNEVPFQQIAFWDGHTIVGFGNVGPGPIQFFPYRAEVQFANAIWASDGLVVNEATQPVESDPPPTDPTNCEWPPPCQG